MEKRQREGGIRTWQKILTAYFSTHFCIEELAHQCEKEQCRLKKNFIQSMK